MLKPTSVYFRRQKWIEKYLDSLTDLSGIILSYRDNLPLLLAFPISFVQTELIRSFYNGETECL
jgi:hypothetical protein